ncbi:hypothetical protein ACFHW2_39660, partial [Actinomadura sp. LOL_016]
MTEDNRGPFRASTEDDDAVPESERQEAATPPETVTDQEMPVDRWDDRADDDPAERPEEEPEASDSDPSERSGATGSPGGDRLVAGGGDNGFAPPDGPFGETAEDIPAQDAGQSGSPRDPAALGMGPQEVPLQDGSARDVPPPPSLDKHTPAGQPPPAPLDPPPAPDGPDGRPRPGFVPTTTATRRSRPCDGTPT